TEAPAGAQVIELGKTSLWRAAAAGLAVEPRASRLLFQPHTLKRLWRRLPALVRYLNEARPNALVAAEPRYNAMAAWALRRSRLQCRLVLSEHIQASSHASLANPWADPRVLPLLRRAYLTADAI